MTSPDLTQAHIEKIVDLFPNVVRETRDAEGNVKHAIDFDALRQELADHVVEGPQERYQLDWPGKRQAAMTANAPIAKTLRPMRDESVDFDSAQNIFIEGDNLDALKLLQESYLGQVKLIYIDPPYNTGNDFVYNDDFAETTEEYLARSGQTSEEGERLRTNPETNGRFHSDWLSMMYPRLRIARQLLADDGVIFISMDDGEISNLRRMCDEVFGEDQFIGQIIWKKRNTPPNDRAMGAQHDYMLVYSRRGISGIRLRPRSEEQIARYKNPDNHPKGPWVAGDLTANVKGGRYVASLNYPIVNPRNGQEFWPPNQGNWRFNQARMAQLIEDNEIYFGRDDSSSPKLKRFLSNVKEGTTWTTLWDFAPYNAAGSAEIAALFGNGAIFESPKPTGLIRYVLQAATDPDSIVLDFFAGSASTMHAVMAQNAVDGGNRRYIGVQLDEAPEPTSAAARAGYSSIADVARERIRRAGKMIVEDAGLASGRIDVGFRAFRIDSTNMADVLVTPDEYAQDELMSFESSIKPDRTGEDLLFQVMLDWGLDLSLAIQREQIDGREVFVVHDGGLIACFAESVTGALMRQIAEREPVRAVFRDDAFATDAERINAEQVFKELSPDTSVKAL
ncbi:site-specific DNA-methyltransferase [Zhihengliuella sp.]|uniref:site-specific DNA-methyltransferase n=1 Tax=Zhihengliuella sp. TaxID=1954483 RepID=UPI0028123650|nr:site-specific DNA-methyltransferase [Zhihengliuella sp.]